MESEIDGSIADPQDQPPVEALDEIQELYKRNAIFDGEKMALLSEAGQLMKNFTQDVNDRALALMEGASLKPWEAGFERNMTRAFNPYSLENGRPGREYRLCNALNLLLAGYARKTSDPRWLTLKQAIAAGYRIAKGARAETVLYWKYSAEQNTQSPTACYAMVLNGADVVGLPPLKERRSFFSNEQAEQLIQATGARIEHSEALGALSLEQQSNAVYYNRGTDQIVVPHRGQFKSAADYYCTILHEIAHWTGHESRLNRIAGNFGSAEYAQEELRAEMASAMICSAFGVECRLEQHASCLPQYIAILKKDCSAIFNAAKDAEKIYEMIFCFDKLLRAQIDQRLADNTIYPVRVTAEKKAAFFNKIGNIAPWLNPAKPRIDAPQISVPGKFADSALNEKPDSADKGFDAQDFEIDLSNLTLDSVDTSD